MVSAKEVVPSAKALAQSICQATPLAVSVVKEVIVRDWTWL